jgi:hypothetical protein
MITGYNTDVPHSDVVFHVQTEDKGLPAAWIESLIYVGGQILARKRYSYKKQLDEGRTKKEIAGLMDRQHRLMIAQIRQGKFDDKLVAVTEAEIEPVTLAGAEAGALADVTVQHDQAPAVDEIPEPLPSAPTLDQVILDYLSNEAEQEHLILVLDTSDELALGRKADLSLHTKSSVSGKPVPKTAISVKLISTVSEPATLATGETDAEGQLVVTVGIPSLRRGMGALIITAQSELGTAEIKQLL